MGDDIEVCKADGSGEKLGTFHTLRQQEEREDTTYYALSDFVAPKESGVQDSRRQKAEPEEADHSQSAAAARSTQSHSTPWPTFAVV